MPRFVGIPSVPPGDDPGLLRILLSLKENVELLTDQRAEADKASVALLAGSITAPTATANNFKGLTARGNAARIDTFVVPLQSDYVKALEDIQRLAADLQVLRNAYNTLILQLRNPQ
jgi:hypothetical protein